MLPLGLQANYGDGERILPESQCLDDPANNKQDQAKCGEER